MILRTIEYGICIAITGLLFGGWGAALARLVPA